MVLRAGVGISDYHQRALYSGKQTELSNDTKIKACGILAQEKRQQAKEVKHK